MLTPWRNLAHEGVQIMVGTVHILVRCIALVDMHGLWLEEVCLKMKVHVCDDQTKLVLPHKFDFTEATTYPAPVHEPVR